jgi:hypothetical protein
MRNSSSRSLAFEEAGRQQDGQSVALRAEHAHEVLAIECEKHFGRRQRRNQHRAVFARGEYERATEFTTSSTITSCRRSRSQSAVAATGNLATFRATSLIIQGLAINCQPIAEAY